MSNQGNNQLLTRADVMRLAVTFGLLTGLAEVGFRGAQRLIGARTFLSSDVVWMAPLADVVLFVIVGVLIVATAAGLKRKVPAGVALWLFLFLSILGPALGYPRLHWAASAIMAAGLARALIPVARVLLLGKSGRTIRIAAPTVVMLLTVGTIAARSWLDRAPESVSPRAGLPNILLIVLDTVRSDDLSAYGYELPTTPRLEEVAAAGALFEAAYATAPWTLTSHVSLFTGLFPGDTPADWSVPFRGEGETLAEWLGAQGYETGGFAANLLYLTREMGLSRGFDHYEDYPISWQMVASSSLLGRRVATRILRWLGSDQKLVRKHASDLGERVLEWVDGREGPYFAFVNFMDAHAPYLPPEPFRGEFGPERSWRAPADLARRGGWTREEQAVERAAYDAAIAYLDAQVGSMLDSLSRSGSLDETIVIITSDHGEQFGEKGVMDHGNSLYRTVLEVPLIIRFPGTVPEGVRVPRAVSLRDVPRTIADLVGGDSEFPGASLAPLWRADSVGEPVISPVLAEVTSGPRMPEWTPIARGDMYAVISDGMYYIRNGDGVEELYALTDRPQAADLSTTEPETLRALGAVVDSVVTARSRSRQ